MTDFRVVVLTILILSEAYAIEFLTLARPGASPFLSKLTERENEQVKSICGVDNRKDEDTPNFKISGGHVADVGQFPWAIGVAWHGQSFCGGTMISPRHFLTAAHCVFDYKNDSVPCRGMSTRSGLFDIEIHYGGTCTREAIRTHCDKSNTRKTRIRKVMFARGFHDHGCTQGNDLAIAQIEGKFVIDERSKPICLPRRKEHFLTTHYSTFTNYGYGMDEGYRRSAFLQYIEFQRSAVYMCAPNRPEMDTICLRPDEKIKGICSGDSGSGFQARRSDGKIVLQGVHSIGPKCGAGHPYRSTYVLRYVEDICRASGVCYD